MRSFLLNTTTHGDPQRRVETIIEGIVGKIRAPALAPIPIKRNGVRARRGTPPADKTKAPAHPFSETERRAPDLDAGGE